MSPLGSRERRTVSLEIKMAALLDKALSVDRIGRLRTVAMVVQAEPAGRGDQGALPQFQPFTYSSNESTSALAARRQSDCCGLHSMDLQEEMEVKAEPAATAAQERLVRHPSATHLSAAPVQEREETAGRVGAEAVEAMAELEATGAISCSQARHQNGRVPPFSR